MENAASLLAKHLENVHFGGNWCGVDLRDLLKDVDLQLALKKFRSSHSLAELTFHLNYYIEGLIEVFKGGELSIKDKFSYDIPEIKSEEEWERMKAQSFRNATEFSNLLSHMNEDKMGEVFVEEKYGIYFSNVLGIIEHCHYHLGQMVLLKRFLTD
ncbi:MAG: DUF1572 domain-containing protein [Bacteroidota bacterium]